MSATAAVIVPYAIAVYTRSPLPQILLSLLLFSTVVIFIYRRLPSSTATAPVIIVICVVRYHPKPQSLLLLSSTACSPLNHASPPVVISEVDVVIGLCLVFGRVLSCHQHCKTRRPMCRLSPASCPARWVREVFLQIFWWRSVCHGLTVWARGI